MKSYDLWTKAHDRLKAKRLFLQMQVTSFQDANRGFGVASWGFVSQEYSDIKAHPKAPLGMVVWWGKQQQQPPPPQQQQQQQQQQSRPTTTNLCHFGTVFCPSGFFNHRSTGSKRLRKTTTSSGILQTKKLSNLSAPSHGSRGWGRDRDPFNKRLESEAKKRIEIMKIYKKIKQAPTPFTRSHNIVNDNGSQKILHTCITQVGLPALSLILPIQITRETTQSSLVKRRGLPWPAIVMLSRTLAQVLRKVQHAGDAVDKSLTSKITPNTLW